MVVGQILQVQTEYIPYKGECMTDTRLKVMVNVGVRVRVKGRKWNDVKVRV